MASRATRGRKADEVFGGKAADDKRNANLLLLLLLGSEHVAVSPSEDTGG